MKQLLLLTILLGLALAMPAAAESCLSSLHQTTDIPACTLTLNTDLLPYNAPIFDLAPAELKESPKQTWWFHRLRSHWLLYHPSPQADTILAVGVGLLVLARVAIRRGRQASHRAFQ